MSILETIQKQVIMLNNALVIYNGCYDDDASEYYQNVCKQYAILRRLMKNNNFHRYKIDADFEK